MEQTIPIEKERSLLARAVSKFRPSIFSHPIWVHFCSKDRYLPSNTIQDLFHAAEQLEHDQPGDACQILLICAAHQSHAGQHASGLRTMQQALALAERCNLSQETIWAIWGACALCVQDNNFEQAARYLEYLRAELNEEDEWVLTDFVEVVKQSLLHPELIGTDGSPRGSPDLMSEDLLSLVFDWLQRWGFSCQVSRINAEDGQPHAIPRPSPLRSLVGAIRSSLAGRKGEPEITKDLPPRHSAPELTLISHEPPADASSHVFEPRAAAGQNSPPSINIPVVVQMLGSFGLTIQNTPIKLPASRGLSLLKYILLHRKQDTPREVLMDTFWPDADPEASRNNLNVAMHSLRQSLRSIMQLPVIRFEDGGYGLATHLDLWLDAEEFEQCIREGDRLYGRNQAAAAITKYELAVHLYQGDFLADSPYEEWAAIERERLKVIYLDTLDRLSQIYFGQERYTACIAQCQLILARDVCREDIHCRLMQCYSRLGQGPLAMRQFQICAEALREELDVVPATETIQLYEHIRRRESI